MNAAEAEHQRLISRIPELRHEIAKFGGPEFSWTPELARQLHSLEDELKQSLEDYERLRRFYGGPEL